MNECEFCSTEANHKGCKKWREIFVQHIDYLANDAIQKKRGYILNNFNRYIL